jgi:hypothetical protein
LRVKIKKIEKGTYLRSPKSPSPGMMYAFSLRPWSIHPVIYPRK